MKTDKTDTEVKARMVTFRREPGDPLTPEQIVNLEELAAQPEGGIDTSDIPEWTAEDFKGAVRGKFYRPVKQSVSLRLDADVIA